MVRHFLSFHALILLAGSFVGDPQLLPGQRLEQIERAQLKIETAGTYTLGRSNGALALGDEQSAQGWIVADLEPGLHLIELPNGPGDLTALAGNVSRVTPSDFLNGAISALNTGQLSLAQTALLGCRAVPAPARHHGLARLLLGVVLQRQGVHLDQARELLMSGREAGKAFGVDILALADNSLGHIALDIGAWNDATSHYEEVRSTSTDANLLAMASSGLAMAAAGRNEHELAGTMHEAALGLVQVTDAQVSASITSLAIYSVHFQAGHWYESRANFARAAELLAVAAEKAPDWFRKVSALGQLALVELVRGRYGVALSLMDEAQALAAPHAPSPHDARLLQNRAALAYALGEFGAASDALDELLMLTSEPEARAVILANQALLALVRDDDANCERLYDEVLEIAPADGRARWLALNGKAALLVTRDSLQAGSALAFEALAHAERMDDPHLSALSLMVVSESHLRLGEWAKARTAAEESVARVKEHDANDYLMSGLFSVAAAALAQGDDDTVRELLAQAWDDSARREITSLPTMEAAQVRSRLAELSDWSCLAVDLSAREIARQPQAAATELPHVSRWKSRSLHAGLRDGQQSADTLPLQLNGTTLVEYAFGREQLHAFVQEGDDVRFVALGPKEPIEQLVQEFLDGISDPHQLAKPTDVARLGGALHERLLAPLELTGNSVVIVPSGELSRLPFEALVTSAPAKPKNFADIQFVIDSMDVSYAPSSHASLARGALSPATDRRHALLLGDPTYSSEAPAALLATRGESPHRWDRLPQTRSELSRMARLLLTTSAGDSVRDDLYQLALLEESRNVSLHSESFDLRLGNQASAAALRELAPLASLIHIASHAHIDRWDARRSGLVLAWDPTDQGLFNLADIAELQLNAELVLLSACQTADGRLLNGEGVQSIASAFLAAGARSVIATLWVVQDEQARDLMEAFASAYVGEGDAPESALRRAKRALRSGRRSRGKSLTNSQDGNLGHPHYWAPFLLTGVLTGTSAR